MPASQLKRLKASLREQGITGQQKSKKVKKRGVAPSSNERARREAALSQIRDAFNPFEVKAPTRPQKFDITSAKTLSGKPSNGTLPRPGVTKSFGEEARRKTLLPELHARNKVGGILDRRIGENDASMTPDERAQMRFSRANHRAKSDMFNLEDDPEDVLTHLGRSLMGGEDDFDEQLSQASSDLEDEGLGLKRKRLNGEDGDVQVGDDDVLQPERKKSKSEVMKEVIAKSKLHKYERQQAKEDDEDLREELDKGMGDLLAALHGNQTRKPIAQPAVDIEASINPDRLALLNGADRGVVEKEYDARLRQMTLDKRAQPSERTKTDEEIAKERADKLRILEENRLKRMKGDSISDEDAASDLGQGSDEDAEADDATAFGLHASFESSPILDVEEEDDFVIDHDLVASGSDLSVDEDWSTGEEDAEDEAASEDDQMDEEEDDLVSGLLTNEERNVLQRRQAENLSNDNATGTAAFIYKCPQSHAELLDILAEVPVSNLPIVIQRIRMQHDTKTAAENKTKLGGFATVLVSHIVYLGDAVPETPLPIIETVIRHVHSLSRVFADSISQAFRQELQVIAETNELTPGRLCLLTAIGTIYPTSDHFHQVVTPAITLIARWLALRNTKVPRDFANGAYLSALCVNYQRLSKRYIPELLPFITRSLRSPQCPTDVLAAQLTNLNATMDIWMGKSAFMEMFTPNVLVALKQCRHPKAHPTLRRLRVLVQQARQQRRPLELHRHRPLPIKTAVPLFEDNFNPDKHYDPNFQRSEANKLRNEYKRERKGALRELRKDANFVARERLREKRERDKAHEEKERRIIAEINAEGGQERNEYERERNKRKKNR